MGSTVESYQPPCNQFRFPTTSLLVLPFVAVILASQTVSSAHATANCFSGTIEQAADLILGSKDGGAEKYMLGIDKLLEPVTIRFFLDGHVCGINQYLNIRFEGSNKPEGELNIKFLAAPKLSADTSEENLEKMKYISRLFRQGPSGNARKELTADLILWDGSVSDTSGKKYDFYVKRPRDGADVAAASRTNDNSLSCGDGGCDPLTFYVGIKKGSVQQFLKDITQFSVSKVGKAEPTKETVFKDDAFERCGDVVLENGDSCYMGTTWPFEENSVVTALNKKSYVRGAARSRGDAGTYTDQFFLRSNYLLSEDHRLNVAVAAPLFQTALTKYFDGAGLAISDPISRENSLFWEFKGRRVQFEKNAQPSPSDKSEWWNFRLQVGVTEGNPGVFIFILAMPKTRVTSWALDTVPNDEKFTTELDDDQRFLDLQGRLEVAITKYVAADKASP